MTNDGFRKAIREAYRCPSSNQENKPQVPKETIENVLAPAKVLEPREPYHVEPCWRPNSIRSSEDSGKSQRKESIFTVGNELNS
jgi:hypothetical protein